METVEDVVEELSQYGDYAPSLGRGGFMPMDDKAVEFAKRIIQAYECGKWKYVKDGHEPLQHTHYIVGHIVQGENYCCEAYHRKAGSWYDDEGRQLQVYAFRELDEAPPMEE